MVNTEELIKRLEILFEYYSISASAFADAIGVQRSGLSHLLSGRNKPSLDFIMRIVETYPEVDLYWLLNGKGSFPKENAPHSPIPSTAATGPMVKDLFSSGEESHEIKKGLPDGTIAGILNNFAGDIERIVVFYTNGTFKNYTPE